MPTSTSCSPQLGNNQSDSNKAIWDMRQVMQNPNFPTSDPGAQTISYLVSNTGNLQRTTADWKEFQPRVGFAWDITGTGKHLLRGGYGIARDQIFQNLTLFSIQQTQASHLPDAYSISVGLRLAGGRAVHQCHWSGESLYLPLWRNAAAGSAVPDADRSGLWSGATHRQAQRLPIRGRSSSASVTRGRSTTTTRFRRITYTSWARTKSASSTRTR